MPGRTVKIAEKRDEAVREIIITGIKAANWMPIPEEFHSGDEMGFDISGVQVKAVVEFDKYEVKVRMISPVQTWASTEVYHRQQTFFARNPPGASLFEGGVEGGFATKKCIFEAKKLLVGLYTDWILLQCRKEAIRRKLASFPDYAKEFLEKEKARVAQLKTQILDLSKSSGELKWLFKRGEMTQEVYVEKRKPIHEEIVSLMDSSYVRDPFLQRFEEELDSCKYARNKTALIKSMEIQNGDRQGQKKKSN